LSPPSVETNTLPNFLVWQAGFFLTFIVCVCGGAAGGAIVHQLHPLFAIEDLPQIGLGASAELVQQHRDATFGYRSKNYGAEMAIIGLGLGVALGATSRNPKRFLAIFVGGLAGVLMGAVLGFFAGRFVAHTIFQNQQQTLQDSIGLQASVWGLLLASIVWFVATVHVGPTRAVGYGLVGLFAGVIVAITQFLVSSLMFPASNPLFIVPEESSERLYWMVAFPIVSGLILAFGLCRRGPDFRSGATGQ
jgi:hypothetical protein